MVASATAGMLLVGRAFTARSLAEIHETLRDFSASDDEILAIVDQICAEVAGQCGGTDYELLRDRLYVPMYTLEGPHAQRWQLTAAKIGERLLSARPSDDFLVPASLSALLLERAFTEQRQEDARRAIEIAEQALECKPPDATARNLASSRAKGYLLLRDLGAGEYGVQILEAIGRVLRYGVDPDMHFQRAQQLRLRGGPANIAAAIEDYRAAIAGGIEEPARDAEARYQLVNLLSSGEETASTDLDVLREVWARRELLRPAQRVRVAQLIAMSTPMDVPGQLASLMGLPPAIKALEEALHLTNAGEVDASSVRILEIPTRAMLAERRAASGDLAEADQQYELAFEAWHAMRSTREFMREPSLELIDSVRSLTKDRVEFLLDLGRNEHALEATFSARCGLLENNLAYRGDPPGVHVSTELWRSAHEAFERAPDTEYQEHLSAMRRLDPVAAKVLDLQPLVIDDLASCLSPHEAIVTLFPSFSRVTAFIARSTEQGKVTVEAVTLSETTYSDCVRTVLEWIVEYEDYRHEGPPNTDTVSKISEHLSTALSKLESVLNLGRLADALSGVSRVRIVPFYPFSFVPIHAVAFCRATLFGDAFETTYLPTVRFSTLRRADPIVANARVSVLADPRPDGSEALPFGTLEAATIEALFANGAVSVIYGHAAGKASIERSLETGAVTHLACHGHQGFEGLGVLFAAGGEEVGIQELSKIAIVSQIITVLSCESGLSTALNFGDEFLAIPAALLASGARAVLATLWQVEDRASVLLSWRFYSELLCPDTSPGAALQRAQKWLREADGPVLVAACEHILRSIASSTIPHERGANRLRVWAKLQGNRTQRPYSHPFYWAPFYVMGR